LTADPGLLTISPCSHAEEITRELSDRGMRALFYHGGMRRKERDLVQSDSWMERRT
jgi:superfamily II DNA helicase RecQ